MLSISLLLLLLLMALVPYSFPHADLWGASIAESRDVIIGDRTYTFDKGGARRTGSIIWPIAELFAKYMLEEELVKDLGPYWQGSRSNMTGKTVVELGSGLGVTAATFLHVGAAVVCTDGEESVVAQLQHNLHRNFSPEHSDVCPPFDCIHHLWGDDVSPIASSYVLSHGGQQLPVDFIVGSDIVYGDKVDLWDALLVSIEQICRLGRPLGSEGHTVLLMAQTARYPIYERQFYEKLEAQGFRRIFHRCISRDAQGKLNCGSNADSCNEWEWDHDFDSCADTDVVMRHQLYGYLCPK